MRTAIEDALSGIGAVPQEPVEQRAFKRSYLGDAAAASAIRLALHRAGLAANVVHSHDRLIDVLPTRAGKAKAIAFAARRLGLTLDDCIACGDSGNDACMLREAGRAVLVGNARAEVADLPARPGLVRARAWHADGVIEGASGLDVSPWARSERPRQATPL